MRRIVLAIVTASALSLDPGSGASAKTLVFCSEGSPETLNPQLTTSIVAQDATRPVYDRLVAQGAASVEPALAESWEVSADGLAYTFRLQPGVRFHTTEHFSPSRELDADDVVFSFARQWKADHPYHAVSGGTYEMFASLGLGDLVKSIDRIDDRTVRFVLARPEAPFLAGLASDFASVLSAEYGAQMLAAGTPERVDFAPVGTGPFQLVRYDRDAAIRYKAHPRHWAGRSPLDELVFAITPDAEVRWQKLQAGECHAMSYPNPADLEAMRRHPDVRVLEQGGLDVSFLALNTEKPPFDDVRVRRALNLATDRQSIVAAVFQGQARMAKNPLAPALWSYNEGVEDYPYDPVRAKRLLAEAGHPGGFTTTIWAMPLARPYNPNPRRTAELIQNDWAKVGVHADIVTYELGEYLRRTARGEHDTALLGWIPDFGDPNAALYPTLSCEAVRAGGNRARWCDKGLDDLLLRARRTTDREQRTELYRRAQVLFKEQAPWITIAHATLFEPIRKEVVGFRIYPFGGHDFRSADLQER